MSAGESDCSDMGCGSLTAELFYPHRFDLVLTDFFFKYHKKLFVFSSLMSSFWGPSTYSKTRTAHKIPQLTGKVNIVVLVTGFIAPAKCTPQDKGFLTVTKFDGIIGHIRQFVFLCFSLFFPNRKSAILHFLY